MSEICADFTRHTYYGTKASTYDADRDREQKWLNEHRAVERYLSGAAGRVLDIPVGTGRFLALYRSRGLAVTGMDVSEDMMAQARVKDPDADIRCGDILAIDLADDSVETAVCVRLLNLITQEEMVRAVRELCRVAKDRIILSIRTADVQKQQRRSLTHLHSAFDRAISGTGFRVRDREVVGKGGYSMVLLTR